MSVDDHLSQFAWAKTSSMNEEAQDRLQEAMDKLREYHMQNSRPAWQIFFIQYAIMFKAIFLVCIFYVIRTIIREDDSNILAEGMEINSVTPLVAGSLFFFSFMVHGVMGDYKEAEKIPSHAVNCIEEYYHCAMIFIRQSSLQGLCTDEIASDLHCMVISAAVEMLCIFRKALEEPEHVDFTQSMREIMTHIDKLNQRMLYILGPNPVGSQLVAQPKELRSIIRRVRTMIDTDFWPVGYLFMITVTFINTVVMGTVRHTHPIAEYSLIPGIIFMFIFVLLMMGDIEDPFSHNVSQAPMEDLRARYLYQIKKMNR